MYQNRTDAGQQLAQALGRLEADLSLAGDDVVVVGLPRGGVPVAYEVAAEIDAPLDVILVRKLGVPFHRELAMGAIGEDGTRVLNDDVVAMAEVTADDIAEVESRERSELERRAIEYRSGRARVELADRIVVIVDDGVATGSTAKAACQVAAAQRAARIILAVPVAPADWASRLANCADTFVSLHSPASFGSVGEYYRDFSQTSDEDVIACLDRAAAERPSR